MSAMQTEIIFTSLTPDQLISKIASEFKMQLEAILPLFLPPPSEPEFLMTAIQTAEWLQISLPTLFKLSNQKIIPRIRVGSNVRYKKSDILKALSKEDFKKSKLQHLDNTS
jgi:predicted DNA-binding transcriptional regulator AlpA